MLKEHSAKNLTFITVLGMFILISVSVSLQHPFKSKESSIADVTIVQESSNSDQAADDNKESIGPDASGPESEESTVPTAKVTEENKEIAVAMKPTAEGLREDRSNSSVSRGTNTNSSVSSTVDNAGANFWQNRKTWLQPVKGQQTADPTGGARYFGAARSDGRAHAAVDFIAPGGTPVYAMTEGTVIRTSIFFQNTSAVEVRNTDGTVARYCEISPSVQVGTTVRRGDVIGKIMTNYAGTAMLHLEMYMGTATGSLSQSNNSNNYTYVKVRNYQRRSDLVDPTGAIYLPVK
jgi:murein DD-endopeptidase MepM/ murein hydrolase activator NlpD